MRFGDVFEQGGINGDERPEGGAGFAVDQVEQAGRLAIVAARAFDFEFHQAPERLGAARESQVVRRNTEAVEVFGGNVNAPEFGVFTYITQNVRQLKRDAAFFGERQRFGRVETENMDGGEADDRRHTITVLIKFVESGDGSRLEIRSDAFDHLVEVLPRDSVPRNR